MIGGKEKMKKTQKIQLEFDDIKEMIFETLKKNGEIIDADFKEKCKIFFMNSSRSIYTQISSMDNVMVDYEINK